MTDRSKSRSTLLSRRNLVRAAGSVVGAAGFLGVMPQPAPAAMKISQQAVGYQDHPIAGNECDKCVQFQAPAGCKVVGGAISPHGCCRIFAPARQAARRSPAVLG